VRNSVWDGECALGLRLAARRRRARNALRLKGPSRSLSHCLTVSGENFRDTGTALERTYTEYFSLFDPVIRRGLSIRNAGKPYRSASNACRAKVANVHRPVRSPVSRARLHGRRNGNSARGNRNAAASALHRLVLQTLDQLLRLLAAHGEVLGAGEVADLRPVVGDRVGVGAVAEIDA
jgi:hypothetical protein